MVRTDQPLVERMALVWHDWFSTSNDGVGQQSLMLQQNELFRRSAFGSFDQLAHDVTQDPAMIVWLNLNENSRWNPNENYARELMELFTLGADRGAYTEQDVRQLARALTGFDFEWSDELGMYDFRYVPARHDDGSKTIFGKTGAWTWEQGVGMCVRHPLHPSFFVNKLWSYFIPTPPSASDRQALETLYVSSGYQVRPVLEAILLHPALHTGARMVKPPVVLLAGLLRLLQASIDGEYWIWYSENAGQRLFYPPDVSGWDDSRWLDTSTIRGRFELVSRALADRVLDGPAVDDYDETETPEAARGRRARLGGRPEPDLRDGRAADRLRGRCAGRRGRLAAQHLSRPAPERAPPPRPRLPRLPDELTMANCGCNDYSRTQLLRRAAAEAGRGLPAIEPGMPLPAGTGLTRRSFVSRATGLALAVYGAASLGPKAIEQGIAAAAAQAPANDRMLVSVFLSGGVDALTLLAPTSAHPQYASWRPTLALAGGAGHAVHRGPALRWHPSLAGLAELTARAR